MLCRWAYTTDVSKDTIMLERMAWIFSNTTVRTSYIPSCIRGAMPYFFVRQSNFYMIYKVILSLRHYPIYMTFLDNWLSSYLEVSAAMDTFNSSYHYFNIKLTK
jgi:hypothetical protein